MHNNENTTRVRSTHLSIPLPSVIALHDYIPTDNASPSFSRRNVFLRDSYKCQYCGREGLYSELTLDHVVPRSKGGKLCWKNVVTCCRSCNGRKGSLDSREAEKIGLKLMRAPREPDAWELNRVAGRRGNRNVEKTWKPYLMKGWGEESPPVPESES